MLIEFSAVICSTIIATFPVESLVISLGVKCLDFHFFLSLQYLPGMKTQNVYPTLCWGSLYMLGT